MTTNSNNEIPDGYMLNAAGHLVPRSKIREQDLLRDQLVKDLFDKALALNTALTIFKKVALDDIEALVAIAGERFDVFLGGNKGNVTLCSYDGRYKVVRSYREVISFTEELEAAKTLIDNCLRRWSEGANANIQAVVGQAFRTNNKGEIKTGKILELMRLDIDDKEWISAMHALRDALQVMGTCVYIRIYERIGSADQWRSIPLDLAAV